MSEWVYPDLEALLWTLFNEGQMRHRAFVRALCGESTNRPFLIATALEHGLIIRLPGRHRAYRVSPRVQKALDERMRILIGAAMGDASVITTAWERVLSDETADTLG